MALQATFTADFKSFDAAVKHAAEGMGSSFSSASKGVQSQLERMAKAFAGDKIIREAALTAQAIEKIGGASKLTEAEQRRANATVTEAIEKYKALGQQAPAALQAIAGQTSGVQKGLASLVQSSGAFSAVLAGGVAGGVAALATAAINATVAVGKLAVEGIGELVRRGGEIAPVRDGFVRLSGGVEQADKALATIRNSTRGLVTDFDAMQASNKAMLLGVTRSGDELGKLAQTATVLGRAMGQGAAKSLDDLIVALGRSSPMILDNLGLSVKVGEANEKYAASLGKTADVLTDAEQKQAFMNAALEAADRKVKELGGVTLNFADRLQIVRNQFQNFTDAMAVGISQSPVLNLALERIGSAMTAAFGDNQVGLVQKVIGAVDFLAIAFVESGRAALIMADYAVRAFAGIVDGATQALAGAVRFGAGLTTVTAHISSILSVLPTAGQGFGKVAQAAQDSRGALDGMAKGLSAVSAQVSATAAGTGVLNRAFQSGADGLGKLSVDMRAASQQGVGVGTILTSLAQALGETGKQGKAAASEIKKLLDHLTGADVAKSARDLEQAFAAFSAQQKKDPATIQRTLEAYEKLRGELKQLSPALEALRTTNQRLLTSYNPLVDITGRYGSVVLPNMSRAAEDARNAMNGLDRNGLIPVSRSFAGMVPLMSATATSTQLIAAQMAEAETQTKSFSNGLSSLAQAFGTLAQVSGGALAGFADALGRAVALADVGIKAGQQFIDGLNQALKGGAKNIGQGLSSLVTGLVSGIGAIMDATDPGQSLTQRLFGGAAAGASYGASIGATIGAATAKGAAYGGWWGAAAGAIVGIMIAVFRGRAARREMEIVGEEWGQSISQGLFKQIQKDQKQLFGGDRAAAAIFNLKDFIKEAGGLNTLNFGPFIAKFRDIFVQLETGKFTSAQALQVIADNFDAFAKQVIESGKLASAEFQELLRLNVSSGLFAPEIVDFVAGAAGRAGAGLAGLLAPITLEANKIGGAIAAAQAKVNEFVKAGTTGTDEYTNAVLNLNVLLGQQAVEAELVGKDLENIGLIALSTFNQALASGVSYIAALDAISPALDAIIAAQKGFGIEGENAALNQLIALRSLGQQYPELVTAAGSLNQTMLALSQMGSLNVETLAALESQGLRTFQRLTDAGFTEQQALAQMADFLSNVQDAHARLGTPIDENTQRLIDQANKYGLLKDKGNPVVDALDKGFAGLKTSIDKLIDAIRGVPDSFTGMGPAADTAAGRVNDALNKIPRHIPIDIEYRQSDWEHPSGYRPPAEEPPSFQHGGIGNFGRGTLAMLHGREAIIPLDRLGFGGRARSQTIQVILDRRVLVEEVVRGEPEFLTLRSGRIGR